VSQQYKAYDGGGTPLRQYSYIPINRIIDRIATLPANSQTKSVTELKAAFPH
jgi:hypothetical protein